MLFCSVLRSSHHSAQVNLPDLLRVAHTYDMAAVRSACVVFISLHVSQVSLRDAPLESAQNVLHLASLANRCVP